jgi:hypothetical protein
VPAPPPAQAADHDARPRWTPERDDALRGAWFDLSVPLDGVAAPVNALDGPRTNKTHIARRAHEIGLPARSEVHAAARARDEAERIAAIDAGTAPPPPRPVQATPRAPETQALIEEARAVAAPVSPGGVDKLTPPREALFRRLWQDTSVRTDDILTQVNALPGPHYTTARGLYAVADRLGLPGTRGAAPAPRPRVATRTEEEIRAQDEREAEALIRIDPERRGAKWVSEEYGWPLDRAQRLVARVRAAIRAEQQGTAA